MEQLVASIDEHAVAISRLNRPAVALICAVGCARWFQNFDQLTYNKRHLAEPGPGEHLIIVDLLIFNVF